MRSRLALAGLFCALAFGGCGGAAGHAAGAAPQSVTLALDFVPNAVHAPVYAAVRDHRDRAAGVLLHIRKPGAGPDALKLVASGKVDVGLLDIQDLALAREKHIDVVGIGALVERPLAALIAQPQITRPKDLTGKTVGVSGLPSDPAFVKAIVEHDGGDFSRIRQVTIGFSAVSRLLSKRVDAVPAFWNAEGVALRQKGLAVQEFRADDYGAPPYPEVVLFTSRRTLAAHRDRIARTLRAIRAGVADVLADPGAAARDIAAAAGDGDLPLVRAQLDAVAPLFGPQLRLDRGILERWADFDAQVGLTGRRPDVATAFDFTLGD